MLLVALVVCAAFVAGREYRTARTDSKAGAWSSPAAGWAGVWLTKVPATDRYGLPAVELQKERAWISGRFITTGGQHHEHDVAAACEGVALGGDDELTFAATTAGRRAKYRMKRTGPDECDLFEIPDPDHALAEYLEKSGGDRKAALLSAEKRAQAFSLYGSPGDPRPLGRLVRVAAAPAAKPGR